MGSRNTRNREAGERIRARREELGMTLTALSKAAGYNYPWQLSKVELDGVMPDPERLSAIAAVLGKSMEWILTGQDAADGSTVPLDVDSWVSALGNNPLAVDLARTAWGLAHSGVPSTERSSTEDRQSVAPPRSGTRVNAKAKSEKPAAGKRKAR